MSCITVIGVFTCGVQEQRVRKEFLRCFQCPEGGFDEDGKLRTKQQLTPRRWHLRDIPQALPPPPPEAQGRVGDFQDAVLTRA